MSILTSKPQKSQTLVDPILLLLVSAWILLTIFAVSTGDLYYSIEKVFGSFSSPNSTTLVSSQPSFAADQQYWEANCSRGWSSDTMCEAIVTRAEVCSISVDSAYCSEYKSYIQQYLNK